MSIFSDLSDYRDLLELPTKPVNTRVFAVSQVRCKYNLKMPKHSSALLKPLTNGLNKAFLKSFTQLCLA